MIRLPNHGIVSFLFSCTYYKPISVRALLHTLENAEAKGANMRAFLLCVYTYLHTVYCIYVAYELPALAR